MNYKYDFHLHYRIKTNYNLLASHGLSGLVNQGNKCFFNSIIQCLANTISLTDYMLTNSFKNDITKIDNLKAPERHVLLSYSRLILEMWNENQIIKPMSLLQNVSIIHRKYFTFDQQDSHEFLLYFLDILHKAITYSIDIEIKGKIKTRSDNLMKQSLETWYKFYENDYSYIIELFNSTIINTVKCNDCKKESITFEPTNTFSIDIANSSNLKDCLNNYFNTHNLSGYTCEKCNSQQGVQESKLWTVADYLIINLKRFNANISKNSNCIDFPIQDLDISQYISVDRNDKNNYIYDLYAVCYHSGELTGGHYWASCKNLDRKWYTYNDANVSEIVTPDRNDAYILFYQRKLIRQV